MFPKLQVYGLYGSEAVLDFTLDSCALVAHGPLREEFKSIFPVFLTLAALWMESELSLSCSFKDVLCEDWKWSPALV